MNLKKFLVAHNYGMGALYWWIESPSEDEIMQTYAEVQIVDVTKVDLNNFGKIPSLRVGTPAPAGLDGLAAKRRSQRDLVGYGALIGYDYVYIKQDYPDEQESYFVELDGNGYRTRQVTVSFDGRSERSGPDDWPFNPPEDLWNPELAACQITREEFEAHWEKAAK